MMNPDSRTDMTDSKALGILTALTLACFLPLVGKAFHVDEPMYLWAARQIIGNPLDFYGFSVNWDGLAQPMAELMQNPPLSAYYLALLAGLFGWHESPLHAGFLVMGLATVWGTYRLARDMSCRPAPALFAALTVFCTPAFLVLANYVACDMAMLAAWVWAVILWRRALRSDDWRMYLLSGLLTAAASLTKYFGMALIPLLLAYSFAERRRPGHWLWALLIPAAALAAYQVLTWHLYGHGLLSGAAAYAAGLRVDSGVAPKTFTGCAFVGGSLVSVLFSLPLVAGRRGVSAGLLLTGLLLMFVWLARGQGWVGHAQAPAGYLVQAAVMAAAGAGVMLLVTGDAWKKRDPDSLLLLCWIVGTFVFTCYLNWTISVRNILPMAPAVGLLLARRIEDRRLDLPAGRAAACLAPALAISVMVAWADYGHAGSARSAAGIIARDLSGVRGNVWFQGHWGFQYYMELLGMRPVDFRNSALGAGDVVIVPGNNSNTGPLAADLVTLLRSYSFDTTCCLATMNAAVGAGFYTDDWGGLPFVIGPAPAETYQAFLLR